jgi:hypothetical protein
MSVPGTIIASGNQPSSVGTLVEPTTADAFAGDFVVACIFSPSGILPTAMTDALGAGTWTLARSDADVTSVGVGVFWSILDHDLPSGTNFSVTLSGNQAQMRWLLKDYGASLVVASPQDVTQVRNTNTLTVTTGNTPAFAQLGELAIMATSVNLVVGSTLAPDTDPTTGQPWLQVGSLQVSAAGNKVGMMAEQQIAGAGPANGAFHITAPSSAPPSATVVATFKLRTAAPSPYQWVKGADSGSGFVHCCAADPTTPDRAALGGDVFGPHTTINRGDRWVPRMRGRTSVGTVDTVAEAWSRKRPGLLLVGIGTQSQSRTAGSLSYIDLTAAAPLDRTPVELAGTRGVAGFGASADLLPQGNTQIRAVGRRIVVDYDATSGTEYVYWISNAGFARAIDTGAGLTYDTAIGPTGVNVANAWSAMAMDDAGGCYFASYRTDADYTAQTGSGSQLYYIATPRTATDPGSALPGAPGVIEDLFWIDGLLWAACGPLGVWTFDGTSWAQVSASTFAGIWITSVTGRGQTVFVGTENPPSGTAKSIARSEDGGSTWTWVSQTGVSPLKWGSNDTWWLMSDSNFTGYLGGDAFDVSLIELDYFDPNYVYVAGRSGVWMSRDGGDTWRPAVNGANGGEVHGTVVGPLAGDVAADNLDWDGWTSHDHAKTAVRNESQAPITGNGGGPVTVGGHTYLLDNSTAPPTITRDGVSIIDDYAAAASFNSSFADIQVSSDGVVYIATFGGVLVGYPPATWVAPITGVPTLSETAPGVGDTITADQADATWGGTKPLAYGFEWRSGPSSSGPWTVAPGAGRLTASYTVDAADAGRYLQCRVTGYNIMGTAFATAATSVVAVGGSSDLTAFDSITVTVTDVPTTPGGGGAGAGAYDYTIGTRIDPWLRLDGVEIANVARTLDYLRHGAAGPGVGNVSPSFCSVLYRPDGSPLTYVNPVDDPAPWYDPTRPESSQFLGIVVTDMKLESVTKRSPVDLPGNYGGATTGPRQSIGRRVDITATLISASKAGAEYGLEWLDQVLGAAGCDTCGVAELEYRRTCPPDDGSDDQLGYWLAKQVALVSGPDVTAEDLMGNQTDVTWQWASALPYIFKPIVPCVPATVIDQTVYANDCLPFDEWLCAPAGGGQCCTISPPRSGIISPIVTLRSPLGIGDVVIASYATCPPDLGVDLPVTSMMVTAFSGTLIIDCSQRLVTYISADGSEVRDGTDFLNVPAGQPLQWIDVDSECDEAQCVCVYMASPCGGGENGTVQIDTQFRRR